MPLVDRLDDGFSTKVSFSDFPSVEFWEKDITPPGFDAGGPNVTTTMRNLAWRTQSPKKLKTVTPVTLIVAFSTTAFKETKVQAMMGVNTSITFTFPDGALYTIQGWVDKFIPEKFVEGAQPMATITIEPSNQDDNKNEVAPVFTDAP